jgi:hypothetical protein
MAAVSGVRRGGVAARREWMEVLDGEILRGYNLFSQLTNLRKRDWEGANKALYQRFGEAFPRPSAPVVRTLAPAPGPRVQCVC